MLLLAGVEAVSAQAENRPVGEGAPDSALAQLERFGEDLRSLRAAFQQWVIGTDGEVLEEGSGEVWLRTPKQFRWRQGGEFPELIVADGERLWLYDESLEQVTVRRQSDLAMDSPLMLLGNPEALERQFRLAELGELDGRALLELTPHSAEAEFERVILGLADDRPVTMTLEDAFGLRTEIRFEDLRRNEALDAALFRFEAPAGVDLVGDLEGLELPGN